MNLLAETSATSEVPLVIILTTHVLVPQIVKEMIEVIIATRPAASWRLRDAAKPRCRAPDETETLYAELSAAHTDPSLVLVVVLC